VRTFAKLKRMRLVYACTAASLLLSACMRMNAPTSATAQAFASAAIGQRVELVVRVDARAGSTLRGQLAEQVRGSTYRLAGPVTLTLPQQTPVSMGTLDDVQPNAIVFVQALITGRGSAEIKKLVVLTSYVHIE